jgi:hypothetical protein
MLKSYVLFQTRAAAVIAAAALFHSQMASAACDLPMFGGARMFAAGSLGSQMIATGDFNHDGFIDLAVINNPAPNNTGGSISVLLSNGDGTFQPAVNYPVAHPLAIAVADFNGDGNVDLAVGDGGVNGIVLLPGKGDGTFGAAITAEQGQSATSMAVADFNGDGKPDLAIGGVPAYLLLNNGNGTFGKPVAPAGNSAFAGFGVAVGDFNGDGKPDVIAGSQDGVFLLIGDGKGGLAAPVDISTGNTPSQIVVADVNGDKKPDVVELSGTGNAVSVLVSNGNGTFKPAISYPAGTVPNTLAVADFKGTALPI